MAKRASKAESYCIIRCRDAGVHAGILVSRDGREVVLRDSRRLWRWWSRFSLSELALEGPSNPAECRFAAPIPQAIVLLDACEVLPCTSTAEQGIRAVKNA